MQKSEVGLPIFDDEDLGDLVSYSKEMNAGITKYLENNTHTHANKSELDKIDRAYTNDERKAIDETIAEEHKKNTQQDEEILKNKKDIKELEVKNTLQYSNAITKIIEKIKNATIYSTGTKLYNNKIYGESSQETREGKNLYNVKDTSSISLSTVDSEDWITATLDNTSGQNYLYANYFTNPSKELKPNTQYYIVTEIKDVKGDIDTLYIVTQGNQPTQQFKSDLNYSNTTVKSKKVFVNKNQTIENFENSNMMLRSFLRVSAGQSGSVTYRISVIEDVGQNITEDNFIYEPYGAMPSIDTPSEVVSVGHNVNLFDKYGKFTYSFGGGTNSTSLQEDGTIISTSRNYFARSQGQLIKNLKPNTDYTVSGTVLSCVEKGVSNIAVVYIIPYESSAYITRERVINTKKLPYNFKLTFNTGENTSVWISLNGDRTENNESTTPVFDKIKIEEGSKATPYTSYNCGSIDYKITGKNLCDISKIPNTSIITNNGDGTLTLQNNNNHAGFTYTDITFDRLVPNMKVGQRFIISFETTSNSLNKNNFYCNSHTFKKNIVYTYTEDLIGHDVVIYGGYEEVATISDIMVEIVDSKESKATEYEPYKEFNTTIELPEGVELCSLPDGTRDYIDSDGVIHKKINKIEVDSFSSVYSLDKRAVFIIKPQDCTAEDGVGNLICTHAINNGSNEFTEADANKVTCRYSSGNLSKQFYLFMPLSYFSSTTDKAVILQEMNEILKAEKEKGTPLTFYYLKNEEDTSKKLADSEIEKLQNLKTFLGVTNITITAPLSASYNEDINYTLKEKDTRIEKLESRIDELEKLIKTAGTSSVLIDNLEGGV